ncbi:MAG: acetate kinase [Clostridiales bacterium]|nr:acetate kinase [Clostridiales bacterium]
MKVLVINCGSSSLKYQVLEMETEELLCKGLVERIGIDGSVINHVKSGMDKWVKETPMKNHTEAKGHVLEALVNPERGIAKSMKEISAVGHRVVHAGEKYANSVLITDEVIEVLKECSELAPLHNPANLQGIAACRELMPDTPMVAVFDTAFHQTMPPESYIYGLPYEYYEKYAVRRYGFHGTSHKYVAMRATKMLGKDMADLKLITCHLGNGASIAAVKNGKVFDTSMGFTPVAGLVMGTRCGDIDPAILAFVAAKEDKSFADMDKVINKQSGVYGLSGVSSDFRDVEAAADEGNERAKIALKVYAHRVKAYIGAYIAEMNGCDAIIFTAGLAENGKTMRKAICENMDSLGIVLCDERNDVRGKEALISAVSSDVKILLIPTNEELMIAKDTYEIVGAL